MKVRVHLVPINHYGVNNETNQSGAPCGRGTAVERDGVCIRSREACRSDLSGHGALGDGSLHVPYGPGGVRDLHGRIVAGLRVGHAGRSDALRVDVAHRRFPVRLGMVGPPDVHARDPRDHDIRHLDGPPAVAYRLGTFCEAAVLHRTPSVTAGTLGGPDSFRPSSFSEYAKQSRTQINFHKYP